MGSMEKLEVKYEPFTTDRMMKMERMQEDDDDVGFSRTKKDKKNVSFVLSSLALLTGLVLFTLVITWLWGVPEVVTRNSRLIKEMADRLETQAEQIRDLEGELQVCQQPAEVGSCTGSAQRWYYSSQKGSCQQFSYSGCGGNSTTFTPWLTAKGSVLPPLRLMRRMTAASRRTWDLAGPQSSGGITTNKRANAKTSLGADALETKTILRRRKSARRNVKRTCQTANPRPKCRNIVPYPRVSDRAGQHSASTTTMVKAKRARSLSMEAAKVMRTDSRRLRSARKHAIQ